ncbi:MAG: hypothetical protein ABSA17_00420 [Rhabdochlamydiaceae bacterium]
MALSTALTYITPTIVDSVVTCWKARGDILQKDAYDDAFLNVTRTVAAVAGLAAFVQFGSKLCWDHKYIAAALAATAFPATASKLPFVAAMYLSGKGGLTALKSQAWAGVAKNIGFALTAALLSSKATQAFVTDYTKQYI